MDSPRNRGNTDDLEFHAWISCRRGRSLELLFALRRLFRAAEHWAKHDDPGLAHAWNRLIGAGFALWRALPLLSKSEDEPSEKKVVNVDDAMKLLDELILHNRVTYGEDLKTSKWMAGFYLNCAEDRIRSTLSDELKKYVEVGRPMPAASLVASHATNRELRLSTASRKRWTAAWNGLREMTILIAERAVATVGAIAATSTVQAQDTLKQVNELEVLALE